MGNQNFDSVPQFPQNWGFSVPNCTVLDKNSTTRKFFDRLEFPREGFFPHQDATGVTGPSE